MNEVTSNQALRSMTLSFLKVLGDCRREVNIYLVSFKNIYESFRLFHFVLIYIGCNNQSIILKLKIFSEIFNDLNKIKHFTNLL